MMTVEYANAATCRRCLQEKNVGYKVFRADGRTELINKGREM